MKNRSSEQKMMTNMKRAETNMQIYGVKCVMNLQENVEKANASRWATTYDRFIKDNEDAWPLFTKEYFC